VSDEQPFQLGLWLNFGILPLYRLVIHKPSTNNPGKPNSAPHPVCMNGRRTPERKRPSIWGCHLIGRSELITTLARTEKMFQSERKAVLLHIFSKESEVRIEISADDCDELDKNQDSTKRKRVHPQDVR